MISHRLHEHPYHVAASWHLDPTAAYEELHGVEITQFNGYLNWIRSELWRRQVCERVGEVGCEIASYACRTYADNPIPHIGWRPDDDRDRGNNQHDEPG